MKKFTLPFGTDADSNQSAHTVNDLGLETELPRITTLNILLVTMNKRTTLKVIGDAVLLDIKCKLLKAFGSHIADGQNMGLFLPSEGGKMGKFLEEERLLSEYTGERTQVDLEFIHKIRIRANHNIAANLADKFTKVCIIFVTVLVTLDNSLKKDLHKTFMRYVSRGDHKKVSSILSKGFDPNFQCPKTGETPLTLSAALPKANTMISILIANGAHRDYYSKSGLTALHKAAITGNFEAVKTLLDFGQSPNSIDAAGLTPLYYNIIHDQDTKICHSLLYEHSELGVYNHDGLQEIHQASRLNRIKQINLLIMYGAEVNSRCAPTRRPTVAGSPAQMGWLAVAGDTPLHTAAAAGQREAVMRLLSWGADPSLLNTNNQTAVQVAQSYGHLELAECIRLFRGGKQQGDDEAVEKGSHLQTDATKHIPTSKSSGSPRHFSRLTDHDRIQPGVHTNENHYDDPTDELHIRLQREGSQTDSGISSSSTDKNLLVGKYGTNNVVSGDNEQLTQIGNAIEGFIYHIYVYVCRPKVQNLERLSSSSSVQSTSATDNKRAIRPSLSCFDRREWRLNNDKRGNRDNSSGNCTNPGNLRQTQNTTVNTKSLMTPILAPRTVVIQKSSHSKTGSSFGLSLRTTKNADIVAHFHPTLGKPSLQIATRIIPNMPAYNAGIREGDFVLKINGVDITRFSHEEVVQYLSTVALDSVCLTIASPCSVLKQHPPAPKPPLNEEILTQTPDGHHGLHKLPSTSKSSNSTSSDVYYSFPEVSMYDCIPQVLLQCQQQPSRVPDVELTKLKCTATHFSESSGLSSARCSDRTNCSSIRDEGVWSQSMDEVGNTNVSGYKSTVNCSTNLIPACRPMDTSLLVNQPADKLEKRMPALHSSQTNRLPRSQTVCGLSDSQSILAESPSTAQSFYFPKNPRFQRVGSRESNSSVCSIANSSRSQTRSGVVRSHSGSTSVSRRPTQCSSYMATDSPQPINRWNPTPPKLTVIKADRSQSIQRECSQNQPLSGPQLIRRYPAHRVRTPSLNRITGNNGVNSDLIILPPAEFR
ncbi:SH3 and multiple ankyrin repeat domains protein [Paragonimus westermani]|uniref:SH3 and multiple ankyrin repeat domains protein n=1 Tax=Paragonimus westermani TaxID=34504 RepID=A0A5J4NYF8_9TREM|nr:SH3 and multiple ankyrin repeat domains protein [Paragonimus westermani]